MGDIACGKQHLQLEEFAAGVNAAWMKQWPELGLYDPDAVSGWGEAFAQVMKATVAAGGVVHFNLTGVDVTEALAGNPDLFVGRYTEFELQQIKLNPDWLRITKFYLDGRVLTDAELVALGIVEPLDDARDPE